jgi:hypothetical protein
MNPTVQFPISIPYFVMSLNEEILFGNEVFNEYVRISTKHKKVHDIFHEWGRI